MPSLKILRNLPSYTFTFGRYFRDLVRYPTCNTIPHTVAADGKASAVADPVPYGLTLFDVLGQRKYISLSERSRFLTQCKKADWETRLFCLVLLYTGCRISEALALTPDHIDVGTLSVVFRTLKRRCLVHRAVPVPSALVIELVSLTGTKPRDQRIWSWTRPTGWRRVKAIMAEAGIKGPQASPKGLRHGFGVANAEHNVPAALTQQWMGHADLETTAIYQQAKGAEARRFAKRLWQDYGKL